MPATGERLHGSVPGRLVAMCRRAVLVVVVGYGPDPLRCRRAIGEHNPPDDLPSPEDVVDLTGSSGCASQQQLNHSRHCAAR